MVRPVRKAIKSATRYAYCTTSRMVCEVDTDITAASMLGEVRDEIQNRRTIERDPRLPSTVEVSPASRPSGHLFIIDDGDGGSILHGEMQTAWK